MSLVHAIAPHPTRRALRLAALFAAELLALMVLYQMAVRLECHATGLDGLCRGLRSLAARGMAVMAVAALVLHARPALRAGFVARVAAGGGRRGAVALHAAGLALLLVPLALALAEGGALSARFAQAAPFFALGALAAGAGAALWLMPARAWAGWLAGAGRGALAAFALALVVPDIAGVVLPLWNIEALTGFTFGVVASLLWLFEPTIYADPASYVIGVRAFHVEVAAQCAGLEGIALITVFSGIAFALHRDALRPGRWFLVLLPLALAASWGFNVLRIAVLIAIGAHVSPELAVNGFHSYAGWLFFTLLSLAILVVAERWAWLRRDGARAAPVQGAGWLAARIVPFVVFMLAGIVAAAVSEVPGLAYPLVAGALAAALVPFARHFRALEWRADPGALALGLAVGAGWIATAPAPGPGEAALAAALAGLGGGAFALWLGARLVGHVALVPLVEEAFFRGYLLARLDLGGWRWRAAAVVISSAAFAALHGRPLTALVAGAVFAAAMLRRGRLGDAVLAHAAANALIAAWWGMQGDWARI